MKARIHFDGGCKNLKGELNYMGVGVVVYLGDNVVKEISFSPPILGTSNIAEWIGCLLAFNEAKSLISDKFSGVERVEIYSDSKLVVNQVKGDYTINNENFMLYHSVCEPILKGYKTISINHIKRAFNQKADSLATAALKRNVLQNDS